MSVSVAPLGGPRGPAGAARGLSRGIRATRSAGWYLPAVVVLVCAQIRSTSALSRSRVISSSAPKGSSISNNDGSSASARSRRRARSQPRSSSGSSTLRTTVRQSISPACWKAIP